MTGKETEARWRHEYKYLLTPAQEAVLSVQVGGVLMMDKNAQRNHGRYHIHSVYFDDVFDTCLKENLTGADPRSKFRMRYYNRNLNYVVLEKKSKQRGMGVKKSCVLTPEECVLLLSGRVPVLNADMPEGKKQLLTELRVRELKPRVIVDYERIPFVYPGGSVRVTFDRNLTASDEISRFFSGDYRATPVMPQGQSILEVKWNELLPRHIRDLIRPEALTWTAFSKYALCRANSL